MKPKLVLFVLAVVFLSSAAFAQERSRQLLTNGVTVTIVNNGMGLTLSNGNTNYGSYRVDIVVYYADGTSELKLYIVEYTYSFASGSSTWVRGDNTTLPKRATAISLPTAAQAAQLRAQREAEAAERARREATERAERERREAAERAERERREAEERTARENAERIRREAPAFLESGTAAFQRGDYARAIADFTRSLQGDPRNATTYNNRGAAYNQKRDWDRAIADFNEAIRIDPNYAAPYRHRAFAHMQKDSFTQARTDVNRALQINPNYQSAQELSAELQRRGY